MAPEQIRGLRARRTSDLWALGVILFEASTGQHPFFEEGESLTVDDAIARLTAGITIPRHIPEDVGNLILRCLSEPAYRRGTVAKALSRLNGEEF
jgi:serine/threonine protein kinase